MKTVHRWLKCRDAALLLAMEHSGKDKLVEMDTRLVVARVGGGKEMGMDVKQRYEGFL